MDYIVKYIKWEDDDGTSINIPDNTTEDEYETYDEASVAYDDIDGDIYLKYMMSQYEGLGSVTLRDNLLITTPN